MGGGMEGERESKQASERERERESPVNSCALYAETSTVVAKNSHDDESYAPIQKENVNKPTKQNLRTACAGVQADL